MAKKYRPIQDTPRPQLAIPAKNFPSGALKVGKKARVVVEGKILREALDDYEIPNGKGFRMEVSKVSSLKKSRRFGR